MRGSNLPNGFIPAHDAHTIDGARLRAGFQLSEWMDLMQALENVTAAGIFVIEHAN